MIRYELRPGTGDASVTFMVQPEEFGHQTVAVVGDFNGWDPDAHVMEAERAGGALTVTIPLPVGRRYAFRYLAADGTWRNDDDAHGWDDNGVGGKNSVLDLRSVADGSETPPVPGLDDPTASMVPADTKKSQGQAKRRRRT